MNIQLGTLASESTLYDVRVTTRQTPIMSQHVMNDGSYKIQEASTIKKIFEVEVINIYQNSNIESLETEYAKRTSLNFIFKAVSYTVKIFGDLGKSTGSYGTVITLVEV